MIENKIIAVDVDYGEDEANVAGVVFSDWEQNDGDESFACKVSPIQEYIPGKFYLRELPCIVQLLEEHVLVEGRSAPSVLIVDGFVFLDGNGKPGLGKHLYDALDGRIPIIGVAKKSFKGCSPEAELLRGESAKPLFITAVGIPLREAKENILRMHGDYRFPTLLKLVDRLCRVW